MTPRAASWALLVVTAPLVACVTPAEPRPVAVLVLAGDWGAATLGGAHNAWPGLLTQRIREAGVPITTMNGSAEGETFPLAAERMPLRMRFRPELVVIAVGTDTPTADDAEALHTLVRLAEDGGAELLLVPTQPALNAQVQTLAARDAHLLAPAITLRASSADRAALRAEQRAIADQLFEPVLARAEAILHARAAP